MHQLHEVLLLSFPFQAFAVLSAFEEAGLGFSSEAGKKLTFKDTQCENLSNFLFIKVYSGMWIFKVFKRCSYKTSLFTFRFLWGIFSTWLSMWTIKQIRLFGKNIHQYYAFFVSTLILSY